jgi:hypothetical protein
MLGGFRNTANSLHSGIFGRGGLSTNSVSSLVRLALSTNFPSGLLNQVPGTYEVIGSGSGLGIFNIIPPRTRYVLGRVNHQIFFVRLTMRPEVQLKLN